MKASWWVISGWALASLMSIGSFVQPGRAAEIWIRNAGQEPFFFSRRERPDAAWGDSITIEPNSEQRFEVLRAQQVSYWTDRVHLVWLQPGVRYQIADPRSGMLIRVVQVQRPELPQEPKSWDGPPGRSQREPRSPEPERQAEFIPPRQDSQVKPAAATVAPLPAAGSDKVSAAAESAPGLGAGSPIPSGDRDRSWEENAVRGNGQPDVTAQGDRPHEARSEFDAEKKPHRLSSPKAVESTATGSSRAADNKLTPEATVADLLPSPVPTKSPASVTVDQASESSRVLERVGDERVRPGEPAASRTVRVRAIVDETYRQVVHDWRERIPRIVGSASAYFERQFGIRLTLTVLLPWEYKALADSPADQWRHLLKQSPEGVDLIVAFAGYGDHFRLQPETLYTGQLGRAAFFGQHILIADQRDIHENRAKMTLIHELGHVFGAFHVAAPNLVMTPQYADLPGELIVAGRVPFGEPATKIIQMTRDFHFPLGVESLSPETRQFIQAAFRMHGLANERTSADPITEGYRYLQERAESRAEQWERKAQQARNDYLDRQRE
jgi:hypothetical protein